MNNPGQLDNSSKTVTIHWIPATVIPAEAGIHSYYPHLWRSYYLGYQHTEKKEVKKTRRQGFGGFGYCLLKLCSGLFQVI